MRLFILSILLFPALVHSQCYNRYSQEIFSLVQITSDIPYGQSINYNGDTVSLTFDYYQATGDTTSKRPLLILMHGPDLISGSKTNTTIVELSKKLVKRGYAVANIDYRKAFSMQGLLYKEDLFKATLHAAQDAKAAVRFFKAALQTTNSYNVDSTMIWLGGIGAGSMAAQTAVYLDDSLEVSPAWRAIIQAEGGLEGNSGNPSFSSDVRGVINLSGAVLDTAWMANNMEPLISIHGDLDDYYPYASDSLFAYTHNRTCNLRHELCYKRLNEVTFVQTHNAHADDGNFSVLAANQNGDIPAQFAAGVRALGIKLYYTSSLFCSGGTDLYGYHGNPILGCVKFSDIGAQIKSFLDNNPDEFLFITVEGDANNTQIANGFNSAGLTPYLYQHTFGGIWPTLGDLIDSGQRLIVMTDNSGPSLPGYHHMWTFIQDTEYDFQSTGAFNCNHLRGNANADLFLLNHFLTVASPQPLSAGSTNDWQLVLNRARQCGAARGMHPNLLYIDFFDSGDVFRVADTLNRIGEDFPLVYGSSVIQNMAQQHNLLAELYTMNGQGYAPYTGNWGDTAAAFIADFMIRHYPCEMSCAPPVQQIIGQDSIAQDSAYTYTVAANMGASYQWITTDSIYLDTSDINISIADTTNSMEIKVIETSQYGCVYDTLSINVLVYATVATKPIENNHHFWVHPNPARDQIWIGLNNPTQEVYSLQIYDSQGRLIRQEKQQLSGRNAINIKDLANGVYLLKIVGKQEFVSKFIKQE
ncbi:MAG: T9SS type A sorting domain-containing protein [Aureispira sp.]|nr:T9SS type A sorting domain-containing protein [Aureispira sp.]